VEDARDAAGANGVKGGVEAMQNGYYVSFGNFGWTNVDRFIATQDPKHRFLWVLQKDMTIPIVLFTYRMMAKVQMLLQN
jgi:hypothetical protein